MLKQLYHWILGWATHRYAPYVLFIVAFAESSFFPIPPDALLIPMILANFDKAFRYALICTAGSVLGGILGYLIGFGFGATVGEQIIAFYNAGNHVETIKSLYDTNQWLVIFAAGFSPIPYKIFTVLSGFLGANFIVFVLASLISRGGRFFLVAWLLWRGGPRFKNWIEENFYPLTLIGTLVLVVLVVIWKVVLH